MAGNLGFNGTTATWDAGEIADGVLSVRYAVTGGNSDTTASDDTAHTYEAGVPDIETTVEFLGTTDLVKGDKGALLVTWTDTTTVGSIAAAIVTAVSYGGSMDGALTGSVTFKPST